MTVKHEDFLEEVEKIHIEISRYVYTRPGHPLRYKKSEGASGIRLEIYSKDYDYLMGQEIESCIEIAESHQETCFNTWHIETTTTLVDAKRGHMVTVLTPMLVIDIYKLGEEETV